jgi:hypothetical protein
MIVKVNFILTCWVFFLILLLFLFFLPIIERILTNSLAIFSKDFFKCFNKVD